MDFNEIKKKITIFSDQLELVLQIEGCGLSIVNQEERKIIGTIYIYEKNFTYLSLLIDEFEGMKVNYEFCSHAEFA